MSLLHCIFTFQGIYHNHPILYVFTFGLVAAKLTNRLVVSDHRYVKSYIDQPNKLCRDYRDTRDSVFELKSTIWPSLSKFYNQYYGIFQIKFKSFYFTMTHDSKMSK